MCNYWFIYLHIPVKECTIWKTSQLLDLAGSCVVPDAPCLLVLVQSGE